MSVSDADFLDWLDSDARRCLLVEATYYSGGAEHTAYLSNCPYQTKVGDTLSACFDDILVGVPTIRAAMGQPLSVGHVVVDNSDGSLDGWLDYAWDGRGIVFRLGDPAWSYDDFRVMFTGVIDDIIGPSRTQLGFAIRDRMESLNIPVQSNLYTSGPAQGLPKPLALGRVVNISPVLIETSPSYKYQVHDGAVALIDEVRDGGWSIPFTSDPSTGTFTIKGTPSEVTRSAITCDCYGAYHSGTWLQKPADMISYLAYRGGFTASDLDTASFAAWNAQIGTRERSGLYIKDRRNLVDCINQICASVAGDRYFNRAGKLALWRLDIPSGAPVMSFTADDVYQGGVALVRREPAIYKQRLGLQPNWTKQATSSLLGGVSDPSAWDYDFQLVEVIENIGLKTTYKGALEPDLIPTLYYVYNALESWRRRDMRAVPRHVWEYVLPARAQMLNLGDVIEIDHPRFGASGGVLGQVVGVEAPFGANKTKVQIWR